MSSLFVVFFFQTDAVVWIARGRTRTHNYTALDFSMRFSCDLWIYDGAGKKAAVKSFMHTVCTLYVCVVYAKTLSVEAYAVACSLLGSTEAPQPRATQQRTADCIKSQRGQLD